MARTVAVGAQDFSKIREYGSFLVDKTVFIKDWWESQDDVTLITRPRRFGKTLNMDMLDCFFSTGYANRSDLFEGLKIWEYEEYRNLQGTYPVISLSFSEIKNKNYKDMVGNLAYLFGNLYEKYQKTIENSKELSCFEKEKFNRVLVSLESEQNELIIQTAVKTLSNLLSAHYQKKVIILLDEYDTPLQEAYTGGFWDEMVSFMRIFFNSTFKSNKYMQRAVMTGITRVSKESLFSDMNNLELCTLSSVKYQEYFGFTEQEVFDSMDEFGYTNKDEVKYWYDGFTIGEKRDIYNPWSIINFLDKGKLKSYWSNTSSNGLVSRLIREGNRKLKTDFENLLGGGTVQKEIDEEMVFNQLESSRDAVWSLLAMSGYLRINSVNEGVYELQIVNHEVMLMFRKLIKDWFMESEDNYSDFISAMLCCDIQTMNEYMNLLTVSMISSFDSSKNANDFLAPEKFYHGFVLGLLVELREKYSVKSNRESGIGRYDVMLIPKDKMKDRAFIIEFKVVNRNRGEKSLEDALKNALKQIEENRYEQNLTDMNVPKENIVKYGFAFEGKKVLIGMK